MLKVSHLHGFNARRASSGDASFANVVLLMGFEGTDGSTSFTDESPAANSCTAVGNAQVDTAQFKFGTSSALFDGSGDRIDCGASQDADFAFGTGDFTVECWFRPNASSGWLMGGWQNNSFVGWAFYYGSGNLTFQASAFGTAVNKAWTPTNGVWYHLAACRIGTTLEMFVDGTSLGTATMSDSLGNGDVSNGFALGSIGTYFGGNLNGWLDEVRITKGVGRYSGSFTAPTAAFPRS